MGADSFIVRGRGKTATAAFLGAVERAEYEDGHGGYTGTIAEKNDFVLLSVPDGITPRQFTRFALGEADVPDALAVHRDTVRAATAAVEDKWGPAGCVQLGPDEFLFFGWAPS